MIVISDAEALNLERVRLQQIEKVRKKGVEVSNNAQLADIPAKIEQIPSATDILDKSIKSIESMEVTRLEQYVFYNCALLEKAYFPNVVSIGDNAFNGTNSLNSKNGYFPNLTSISTYAFYNSGFENIIAPSLNVSLPYSAGQSYFVRNAFNLKRIIMPLVTGSIVSSLLIGTGSVEIIDVFYWKTNQYDVKSSVKILIIRNASTLSPAENNLTSLIPNATVYVPQALLQQYKQATNWSAIENQIVAIEGTKYEPIDWYKDEDWFKNMYHYTSVLDEEESEE